MGLQLEDYYLEELRRIVARYVDIDEWHPVIFGSRANGTAHKFSDIDIGFIGTKPLPFSVRSRLWNALDDSNIPYMVDIVDLSAATTEFRNTVEQSKVDLIDGQIKGSIPAA